MKSSHRTHPHWLRAPWCAAVLALAAISGLNAQSSAPAAANGANPDEKKDANSDVVELEPFEVTGSRIKRIDAETVSPVVELRTADLARIGFPTVGDALRAMPFNSGQALTPTDSGNSFTPGVSTINLRGLGNNETLVLINGRRAVPYATPGFNGLQTVFDFNSLPQAAIESIEILKDGGSALYGSDAVAGVVNIKMRHDYQGVSATAEMGNFYNTNGLLKKGSLTVGNISSNLNLFMSFDWAQQHEVFARDVKWAADADKTSVAHKANGRYTATGWETVNDPADGIGPFNSEQEFLQAIEATDAIGDGFFDNRSSRGFPGYVSVPDLGQMTFDTPTDNPTLAGAVAGRHFYNFQEQAGLFPEYRTFGFYTSMHYDLNPDLYAFTELSFHRYESTPKAAATPVDLENENGFNGELPMTLPYEIPYDYAEGEAPFVNPTNPFGADLTNGRRRLVELPNRINDVTSDTPRVVVGLGGNLTFLEGWTWETAAQYSRNSLTNLNRGSVSDLRMQQALYGLTRLGNGQLVWDETTPPSEREYFNWFGNNDPAFAKFLEIKNPTSDSIEQWIYDGHAGGRIFDLPAGPVNAVVGFEHMAQKINHVETDLNATGGIAGGSEGTSFDGRRSVMSFYGEADIPVLKNVEVQLAGRYENYSDQGFKDSARPKIGLKVRPFNWLLLRGSYSESFKAPDLAFLYSASSTSFQAFQSTDPVTGSEIDQVQVVTAGNPDLEPETSKTYFLGAVLEAPEQGFLKGLEFSLEYFDLKQKNALAQLSDFYGLAEFFTGEATGNPLFAGKVVRDPATNEVLFIRDDYSNISTTHYKAWDAGLRYRLRTENLGTFGFSTDVTYLDSYVLDGDEIAGAYLTPQWNGTGGVTWDKGDWTVNFYEVVKGSSRRDLAIAIDIFGIGADDTTYLTYDMRPQWISNASITYRGWGRNEITVGATNLFNTTPPVDPFDQNGSTPGVNYLEPGFWYVRLTHNF